MLGTAPDNPLMSMSMDISILAAMATGGLDALPHNGAVITLLGICGLTHRQSYFDIFVVAVAVPLLALGVVVGLGTAFGSF